MFKKPLTRILIATLLVIMLTLSFAPPALAFDGRGGDTVTIPASEVVKDDLYIGAETVVIDGTVQGDVIVAAKTITVNGTIEGDLIAAGQTIIINGTVKDDVRMAGAALFLGEKASIGSDLIGAGASLEARKGSSIGEDIVFAGGQIVLAGDVNRNVHVATGRFKLSGTVGGNVKADVGSEDSDDHGGPNTYITDTDVTIPNIKPGLTIDPAAKIGGSLDYTTAKEINIPEGVVTGKITHSEPKISEEDEAAKPLTLPEMLMNSAFDIVRTIATLTLLGLLLIWLFPSFIKTTTERIKAAPLPSLGWGIVHIAAFFFALLVVTIAMTIGAIVFGVLTLGSLSGTIVFLGLLLIFAIILGFCLAIGFVAQIIISILSGQLILGIIRPELAENKYLPLIVGVIIYAVLAAIPGLGTLVSCIVVLLGLGALWYFGQGLFTKKPVVASL